MNSINRVIAMLMCMTLLFCGSVTVCFADDVSYDIEDVRISSGEVSLPVMRSAQGVGEYIITTSSLNVRSQPSASSQILGTVSLGNRVMVTAIDGYWGKITYNGKVGWISLNYAFNYSLKQHSMSDAGLGMLKQLEGFSKYQYWDYSQYSIGYGTACQDGEYPDGITEEEASRLLVNALVKYELYLDEFLADNKILLSQSQYDALVSFTYNLGDIWHSSKYPTFSLKELLIDGAAKYTYGAISSAFGEFVRAGGVVNNGLIKRRNTEAQRFCVGTGNESPFADVAQNKWYYTAVKHNYSYGIISGTSKKTFSPDMYFSRAMIVVVLGKLEKIDVSKYTSSSFRDVTLDAWYAPYVQWAYTNKITSGTGNNMFLPNKNITREEMITMIYNYTKHKNINVSVSSSTAYKKFADYQSISKFALEAMNWAVSTGCITGDNFGRLNPISVTQRSEAAQVVYNYTTKVLGYK